MADEKKIIIDEDWKSQVQAEKEQLAKTPAPETESAAVADVGAVSKSTAGTSGPSTGAARERPPMPPASLETLCTTLGSQALMMLGQFPHPSTGQAEVDLDYARHIIDTLAMLEEKTQGNTSPIERKILDDLLHKLRMIFVQVQREQP